MPRFTYCPSRSSCATRRTIFSRLSISAAILGLPLAHGAVLNGLGRGFCLEDGADVNARRVNLVGWQFAEIDQLLDFGDDVVRSGGHHGIEVAGRLAIDEVAPSITL